MRVSVAIIIIFVLVVSDKLIKGEPDDNSVLQITNGQIKGRSRQFRGIDVYQFLCIPYGEPPINELRFKKPSPKAAWTNVLTTDEWGPYCQQPPFTGADPNREFSEDCLCLNVFTPATAVNDAKVDNTQLVPVMVWFPGGGFNMESANIPEIYNGTALAALADVVVVTVNYRLGVFGFLHYPEAEIPGNMGFWDQHLALKWVQENINFFGGDPDKVTIFGESAGSMSVSAHIVSPQSKGLFKNAIMQSGSMYDTSRFLDANVSQTFIDKIKCSSSPNEVQSCLSSFKFHDFDENVFRVIFWPIIGDEFLPNSPEEIVANKGVDPNINVMLGTVGNEGAFVLMMKDPVTFSPHNPVNLTLSQIKAIVGYMLGKSTVDYFSEKYSLDTVSDDADTLRLVLSKIIGDIFLTCPTYVFGHDLVHKNGLTNVYAYYQSQKPSVPILPGLEVNKWIPATHADDILSVFGYPFAEPEKFTHEDLILSSFMLNIWTTFAKTGKPFSIGSQKWLSWAKNEDESLSAFTMELNSQKIGPTDGSIVQFCFENWPFPFEKTLDLDFELGKLSKLEDL